MSSGLRKTMFQPVIEQCAVRHAGQSIMKGGVAATFLLFYGRSESKIKHVPFPDLAL